MHNRTLVGSGSTPLDLELYCELRIAWYRYPYDLGTLILKSKIPALDIHAAYNIARWYIHLVFGKIPYISLVNFHIRINRSAGRNTGWNNGRNGNLRARVGESDK